jgi:hypothetical protein
MVPRMFRLDSLPAAIAVLAAAVALAACGDVCDDATQICGFDIAETSADCSGVNECASICIVDWDSCDVNNAESKVAQCIATCLDAPEET